MVKKESPMKFSYPPHFHHDNEPALWQNEWEFNQMVELMKNMDVKTVLEIGTGYGQFAECLRLFEKMKVWSIDKAPMSDKINPKYLFVGASTHWKAKDWAIEHRPKQGYDAVFIDGGHDYLTATADFINYGMMAKKMIIVHDIAGNQSGKYPVDTGSKEMWENFRNAFYTYEFYAPREECCGVGIMFVPPKP